MKKKPCNVCNIEKPLTDFPKDRSLKTGYRGKCKSCSNKQCRKYYSKNRTTILERHKKHSTLESTKNKKNEYMRKRRNDDIAFKVKDNLRRRINYAIKDGKKSQNTLGLTGCDIEQLKLHIESLWLDGMNWNNYGKLGWHIDHIKPCAAFDLSDSIQQKECFHYSNLQPLWAKDNWSKGSKYLSLLEHTNLELSVL